MAQGGVHGTWGPAWWGCVTVGACMAGETATVAGITHPTDMHSCLIIFINIIGDIVRNNTLLKLDIVLLCI